MLGVHVMTGPFSNVQFHCTMNVLVTGAGGKTGAMVLQRLMERKDTFVPRGLVRCVVAMHIFRQWPSTSPIYSSSLLDNPQQPFVRPRRQPSGGVARCVRNAFLQGRLWHYADIITLIEETVKCLWRVYGQCWCP